MGMKTYPNYRRGLRQQGAEIVEFVITLPVILIVVAMMFDLGALFSDRIILTDAVRAAAREVVAGSDSNQIQQAADRVTQSMISADPSDLPDVDVTCDSGCAPGTLVTVSVDHTYTLFLLPKLASSAADINLTATVRMNVLPN